MTLACMDPVIAQSTGDPNSGSGASSPDGAVGESDAQTAAHLAQNPVANVISVPFQNNSYFNYGPYHDTENVLYLEPVVPFKLTEDWEVVTRTIVPIVSLPCLSPEQGSQAGLGNIVPQFYFTPAHAGSVIWGLGPQIWTPSASNKQLGLNKWGGGVSGAVLTIHGPWVVGTLISNIWVGSGPTRVNELTINPFVNFNMKGGWYYVSAPVITSQWDVESKNRWLVPVGGGVGRVFKIGNQLVNASTQVFYNVNRPAYGPNWQLQVQLQFMFPKS